MSLARCAIAVYQRQSSANTCRHRTYAHLLSAFLLLRRQADFAISDDAAANEVRTLFHFFENLGEIFANYSDGEQVQRTKEKNRIARRWLCLLA